MFQKIAVALTNSGFRVVRINQICVLSPFIQTAEISFFWMFWLNLVAYVIFFHRQNFNVRVHFCTCIF